MNDEAFARRFYADRAELESLGIDLKVDKPAEGYYEAENYSLPPENFYLPAIEFTDKELGALRTALSLLDGEFAYAEPLRLALQQLSWGKPSPLDAPEQRSVALAVTAGGGRARAVAAAVEDRDRDLPPQDDRLRLLHDRPRRPGAAQGRPVPPALPRRAVLPRRLLARARRRARVPALAHPRQGRLLVEGRARLPAARGLRPARVRHPHRLAARRPGRHARASGSPTGSTGSSQRHFGHAGDVHASADDGGVVFETEYANSRQLVSWVLGLGEQRAHARARRSSSTEARERVRADRRAPREPARAGRAARQRRQAGRAEPTTSNGSRETPIRPERFARLVTLAGILIEAARDGSKLSVTQVLRDAPDHRARSCARTSTC